MTIEAGQTLSHYRLIEKIGEGGMGVVWKAEDTVLDREVAIKILPEAFSQVPTRLERFKREAKAIAALNHPYIVTIHSAERVDDVHVIAMELVQGTPLTVTLSTTGLSIVKFLDIAIPLVDALKDTPSSVCDIRSDLPDWVGRLIARCLEKDPARRFQVNLDLGTELEGLRKEIEKKRIPSIAVLPLVNMSADPEQEYFCDGIAEEIINGLTHLAGDSSESKTKARQENAGPTTSLCRLGR